jgi:hypothetical protein
VTKKERRGDLVAGRKREMVKSNGILFGSPPGRACPASAGGKGWVFGILKYKKAFVRLYAYLIISYIFNNQQHEYSGLY